MIVIADSGQADHSSERSDDDGGGFVSLLREMGPVIFVRFLPLNQMAKACGACGRAVLGASNELVGNVFVVFHSSGTIHGLLGVPRMRTLHDVVLLFRRVPGSRIVGPFSVSLCARWINRSQIASATLGSPMAACHAVGGS